MLEVGFEWVVMLIIFCVWKIVRFGFAGVWFCTCGGSLRLICLFVRERRSNWWLYFFYFNNWLITVHLLSPFLHISSHGFPLSIPSHLQFLSFTQDRLLTLFSSRYRLHLIRCLVLIARTLRCIDSLIDSINFRLDIPCDPLNRIQLRLASLWPHLLSFKFILFYQIQFLLCFKSSLNKSLLLLFLILLFLC